MLTRKKKINCNIGIVLWVWQYSIEFCFKAVCQTYLHKNVPILWHGSHHLWGAFCFMAMISHWLHRLKLSFRAPVCSSPFCCINGFLWQSFQVRLLVCDLMLEYFSYLMPHNFPVFHGVRQLHPSVYSSASSLQKFHVLLEPRYGNCWVRWF